ncbi:hypothetical protein JOD24_000238 [Kroppenstedtia sanguinis]
MKPVLFDRRGSSTIEYVIILAAGAILAMILTATVESTEIQNSLKEKIECVITQECHETHTASDETGSSPETGKPFDVSKQKPSKEEGFFDMLKRKANDAWEGTKEIASDTWDGIQFGAEAAWEWTKDHKEEIAVGLTVAAGVGLLFVPGGQAFGAGILIGSAVGGGISAIQGNDLKTIMADAAIGGAAGAVGGGVAGGVARGTGRYIGQKATQLFGNATGGSAGSLADDLLRGKKFNWRNAAVAAFLAAGVTHGVQAAKQAAPVFGITPKAEQVAGQQLAKHADEIGDYGKVGGHHIHAKAAFKGDFNYDPKKGYSISQKFMRENGWSHQKMTNKQRELFKELANSGRPNTLVEHNRIAVEALVEGGAPRDVARKLVAESTKRLRKDGVRKPSRIPWQTKKTEK